MFKSIEVFLGILSSTCASNWSLFTSELTSNIPFKIPCITELVQFEVLKKLRFKTLFENQSIHGFTVKTFLSI